VTTVVNPLGGAPVVLVAPVGGAEGARGAAAALACAGADVDRASLLIEVGARPPRPTLLASAAAQRLEERLAAHLPASRVAARGQVCHLAVGADEQGLELAAGAAPLVRDSLAVLSLPAAMLREAIEGRAGPKPTGVLLRADVAADRALLALAVRDLLARGLAVAVLKRRLGWVVERRALFGALPAESAGGLPSSFLRKLSLEHACYGRSDDSKADPTRTAQPERGDHAGTGSR
jgi:hypothetical protein